MTKFLSPTQWMNENCFFGKTREDGECSGQAFREDVVEPELDLGHDVMINIDSGSYTMMWLEEVFGGLIRTYGAEIKSKIYINACMHPWRERHVQHFIQEAINNYKPIQRKIKHIYR